MNAAVMAELLQIDILEISKAHPKPCKFFELPDPIGKFFRYIILIYGAGLFL